MSLTDAEILELERLLHEREIEMSFDRLNNPPKDANPNYLMLKECIEQQQYDKSDKLIAGKRGCALEGSSRSGKTWAGVDIIIWLCKYVEPDGCTINIYRQTYNEFKTTLYDDFKRRLDYYKLPNPFHDAKEVQSFKIGKSKIFFLGDGKHGGGCDYAFFNEIMFISQHVFDQVEMRCRKFWWADYNPSFTDHWFFDRVIPRPDVGFLRTTFRQNRFISAQELNKILSFEPWAPGTYSYDYDNLVIMYNGQVVSETNQPPPHPTNVRNGTADEFQWKVYGLGMRGAIKGRIIQHVEWIDKFPDMAFVYGVDFGFTVDPTAITKVAEDEANIYLELLSYTPMETPHEIDAYLQAIGADKDVPMACDSSDKHVSENKGAVEMVSGLANLEWKATKVRKTKSVMYWLTSMKSKKIHIVKNALYHHAKKEVENYRMKTVGGISINQPIDDFNHFIDSARYGHMALNGSSTVYVTDSEEIRNFNY